MRILHTSDWHIGRQLHNVSLLEDQRHMLDQIVGIIRDNEVDVVIVAGDIYDRSVPPAAAVELLDETVNRICNELKKELIVISGNHDSGERLGFGSRQMATAGLHIIGPLWRDPEPVVINGPQGEVAFYGVPYNAPATVRNLHDVELSSHDEAMALLTGKIHADNGQQRPSVVIAHCYLDGGSSCDSERPLSIGGADLVSADHFKDFTYVALGHLHGPQHKNAEHIRYSGSPLKYSFSEQNHKKGVTLVDIDAKGVVSTSQIPVVPLRNMRIIEGLLEELIEAGRLDPHREDYISARLEDTHAILEPMAKLRDVYPNILHLEKIELTNRSEQIKANRERLKKGEMSMLTDFYQQVTGGALSEAQTEIAAKTLEKLYAAEENH